MKKSIRWILAAAAVILVLAAAFFFDGDNKSAPSEPLPVQTAQSTALPDETAAPTADEGPAAEPQETETPESTPEPETAETPDETLEASPEPTAPPEKDKYQTDPVPEGKPKPVEPQEAERTGQTGRCTISISCATLLDNMDALTPEKAELVPADGWILAPQSVEFSEGESVFDVLLRVCRDNGIHMEFTNTPIYNSAYIEGIGNLYEFDGGNLSGWMYCVNGWFPNYGCSRYALVDGDTVEWVYTCDLGYDVGGGYISGGGE